MILWVVLLGGVAPNVLFRRAAHDGPARVARTAILSLLASAVLWFCGQLNLGTFLASLVIYGLGAELRHRRNLVQWIVRQLWSRFADLFYEPRPADVLAGVGILPKTEELEETEPSWWARVKDGLNTYASESRELVRGGVHSGGRIGSKVAVTTGAWRGRVLRRLRARRPMTFAVLLASACGVAAVLVRLGRGEPINSEETTRLMHLAGWGASHEWLPDLVVAEIGTTLTMSPRIVTTVALGAPLVFFAGWSGAHVIRRLAPGTPPWLGALATSALPALAIANGHTASLGLVSVALAPWLCTCVGDASRRSRRPLLLLTLFAVLHPIGVLCGWALIAGAVITERAERTPTERLGLVAIVLVPASVVCALVFGMGGIDAWTLQPGAVPPRWLVVVAVASGAWLLLGGLRRRAISVTWVGRTLGAAQLALVFASGGFDDAPKLATLPFALEVLTAVSVTACAGDLRRIQRHNWMRSVFALPAVLVGALVVWPPTLAVPDGPGLRRSLLELAINVRQEHLPWNFSIVASRRVLPAFVDGAWVVDGAAVEETFPAAEYYFDPEHPEQIIGTQHTYVVLDGSDPEADDVIRAWVDNLRAYQAYPQPVRHQGWTNGLEVFVLERDPEREETQMLALKINAGSPVVSDEAWPSRNEALPPLLFASLGASGDRNR